MSLILAKINHMDSFFNFQFGKFAEAAKPDWFDWLSLVINLIAIISGYIIARSIYNTEKKDRENQENKLINAETEIFKISITELKKSCDNQALSIQEYLDSQDFILKFNQGVNVDFLKFFDIKNLYEKIGFVNQENVKQLNELLSSLYTLYDFRNGIRDELRTYINKYNIHEQKFYTYKKVLYSEYYRLCNKRSVEMLNDGGIKKWIFDEADLFMKVYSDLVFNTLRDTEVVEDGKLKSRDKLVEKFIKQILEQTSKFIPEDFDAININDLSNQANSAFIDMTALSESHFRALKSYKENLEIISLKISSFLTVI
jgi:hypothetical protein